MTIKSILRRLGYYESCYNRFGFKQFSKSCLNCDNFHDCYIKKNDKESKQCVCNDCNTFFLYNELENGTLIFKGKSYENKNTFIDICPFCKSDDITIL